MNVFGIFRNLRNSRFVQLSVAGAITLIVANLTLVFVALSIEALGFRWFSSLLIELQQWYLRDILNNLASIYPGTH